MTPKSILPWKYKGATTAEGRICIRNLCTAHIYYFKECISTAALQTVSTILLHQGGRAAL